MNAPKLDPLKSVTSKVQRSRLPFAFSSTRVFFGAFFG